MKKRVLLAQPGSLYGDNAFLPYSIGCLAAYARSIPEVHQRFVFLPLQWKRDRLQSVRECWDDGEGIQVLGLSCYIWNWRYNLALARMAKEAWGAFVICGGPQVPDEDPLFFVDHPYVDVLVHGEGEVTFGELLARLGQDSVWEVPGTSTARGRNRPRPRATDLRPFVSPYLAGCFDGFPFADYNFHAVQETHRGCPFACHFCDWGSAVYNPLTTMPVDRILGEYRWCADHQIDLLYNADANFGLFNRDALLVKALAAQKRERGYPKQIRAAYSKRMTPAVFEIAETLHRAGMSKGVTLSLQSLHPRTLEAIGRKNADLADFSRWIAAFKAQGIPTYTEIILGLPEETLESFLSGLDQIFAAGQHRGLYVYPCLMLPNAALATIEERTRYGLRTVEGPLLQQHASVQHDEAPERGEVIIETRTMPEADMREAWTLAWWIQALHCLGLTTKTAIAAARPGLSYTAFYRHLLGHAVVATAADRPLAQAARFVLAAVDQAFRGGPWDIWLPWVAETRWPIEEALYLTLLRDAEGVASDLRAGIPWAFRAAGHFRRLPGMQEEELLAVFEAERAGWPSPLAPEWDGDWERFARLRLHYGRKTAEVSA